MKSANHVTNLPCFDQVAWAIGNANAQRELFKVATSINKPNIRINQESLMLAFLWSKTPQSVIFWSKIDNGINPYEK